MTPNCLILAMLVVGECVASDCGAPASQPASDRVRRITPKVDRGSLVIRRRAIQELELLGPAGAPAIPTLIDVLVRHPDAGFHHAAVLRALRACDDGTAGPALLAKLEQSAPDCDPELILAGLMSLKGDQTRILSRLAQLIAKGKLSDENLAIARVTAIAIRGEAKPDEAEWLESTMRRDDVLGAVVCGNVALIGRRLLPAFRMVPLCMALTESRGDVPCDACMILAAYSADLTQNDIRNMRRFRNRLIRSDSGSGGPIIVSLAVARITGDPEDLKIAIETAACELGGEYSRPGHTQIAGCLIAGDVLADDRTISAVMEALKSENPKTRAGALNLTAFVGRRANNATAAIRNTIETTRRDDVREIAAMCLLLVADSDVLRTPGLKEELLRVAAGNWSVDWDELQD